MSVHLENLLGLVPNLPELRIIDIGAGRGEFLVDCARRKIRAVGLEINPKKN